jgi:hypothetical protein
MADADGRGLLGTRFNLGDLVTLNSGTVSKGWIEGPPILGICVGSGNYGKIIVLGDLYGARKDLYGLTLTFTYWDPVHLRLISHLPDDGEEIY